MFVIGQSPFVTGRPYLTRRKHDENVMRPSLAERGDAVECGTETLQ